VFTVLLHEQVGDDVGVVCVAGAVGGPDVPRLTATVAHALGRQPGGVVVDLQDVVELAPAAADALRTLVARDESWPPPALCLCGAPPAVEQALGGIEVHRTREQAVARLQERGVDRRVVPIEHSVHGPAQARRAVAECAERLGLRPDQGEDLLLVVSEIVTNAVRHGAPPVELEVVADAEQVLVVVADGSPGRPQPRRADRDAEGGRGMALVDVLCTHHGVHPRPPGKSVWAVVRRRPEALDS
jgi:anti-sigma regulatory factor (Ser/Thr protein kinase)